MSLEPQVIHDGRIAALLDAGAHSAHARRLAPADVAAALARLLQPRSVPV